MLKKQTDKQTKTALFLSGKTVFQGWKEGQQDDSTGKSADKPNNLSLSPAPTWWKGTRVYTHIDICNKNDKKHGRKAKDW